MIKTLGKLKQEDCGFEAQLEYRGSLYIYLKQRRAGVMAHPSIHSTKSDYNLCFVTKIPMSEEENQL